jgi:outer membrane protein assembly factor BamB
MEFVEGQDLALACLEQRLGVAAKLTYAAQLCAGILALHAEGLLHRDLKPANVMISPAPWPLTDAPSRPAPRQHRTEPRGVVLVDLSDVRVGPVWTTQILLSTPGFSAPFRRSRVHTATRADDVYATVMTIWWLFTTARRLPDQGQARWQEVATEQAFEAAVAAGAGVSQAQVFAATLVAPLGMTETDLDLLSLGDWIGALHESLGYDHGAGSEGTSPKRRRRARGRSALVAVLAGAVVAGSGVAVALSNAAHGRRSTLQPWATQGLDVITAYSHVGSVVLVQSVTSGRPWNVAVDASTGRTLWQYPAPPESDGFAPQPPLGFSASGYQRAGQAIAVELETHQQANTVVARDAATGRLLWSRPAPYSNYSVHYCGPVVCLVDSAKGRVSGLDPALDTTVWTASGTGVLLGLADEAIIGHGPLGPGTYTYTGISAVETRTGRPLWQQSAAAVTGHPRFDEWLVTSLDEGIVVSTGYYGPDGAPGPPPISDLALLDSRSGRILWTRPGVSLHTGDLGSYQTPGVHIGPLLALDAVHRTVVGLVPRTGVNRWSSVPIPPTITLRAYATGYTRGLSQFWLLQPGHDTPLAGQPNPVLDVFGVDTATGQTVTAGDIWTQEAHLVPLTAGQALGSGAGQVTLPSRQRVPHPLEPPPWTGLSLGGRIIWEDNSGQLQASVP